MNTSMPGYRQGPREPNNAAFIWSVLLHAAVLALLLINFNWHSHDDEVPAKVIDAVVVDSRQLEPQKQPDLQKEQQRQQQKQQELKRQEELKKQQEVKKQQDLKKQQAEQEAIRLKQQQKQQEDLKKQQELKRQEELKKQQAEQQRREEEQRQLQQAQQRELERLQAEEKAAAEQARSQELASKLALYKLAIKQRVERNWIRPVSAQNDYSCEVIVDQIPGGDVINVEVERCVGDAVFQRSVVNAVYKSSPLPDPQDPALFDRKLRFTFKVPEQ